MNFMACVPYALSSPNPDPSSLRSSTQRYSPKTSIELPPRRPAGILALLRLLLRFVRIKSAFFAASNSPVRPKPFKNHLRGGRRSGGVFAILHAETADVFHQPLNSRKLLMTIGSSRVLGEL